MNEKELKIHFTPGHVEVVQVKVGVGGIFTVERE